MGWVRARWQSLQATLLASAYPLATQAKQLLDGDEEETVRRLLSDYMAENTRQMLAQLDLMLADLAQPGSSDPGTHHFVRQAALPEAVR